LIDNLTLFLESVDRNIFFLINELHSPIIDSLMLLISNKFIWIPLYFFLIYFMVKEKNKNVYLKVILCLITVILADFTTSSIMKPFFERLRPCHNNNINEMIHLVGTCKGLFGFASSHASTTFSLASIMSFFYPRIKNIKLLFLWSIVICYSRIYLGVHYPLDIIAGMIIGGLIAILIYKFYNIIILKYV